MTPEQIEQYFIEQMSSLYEEEESRQLFFLTMDHISGWNRSQYLLHKKEVLDTAVSSAYTEVLEMLKKGKPLQHIFSETWFYGLNFKVNSSVLIPRPETEELVHWMLASIPAADPRPVELIDIGTGSGCIAITLKKKLVNSRVTALDVSEEALAVAKENAQLNGAAITFIHADIRTYVGTQKYDVIVSNPPYIRESERDAMHKNVLDHEPHLALFVSNEDPLVFYSSIADFAILYLNQEGLLFFEINEYLGQETVDMLASKGFKNIMLRKDMQGKDRMICCNL